MKKNNMVTAKTSKPQAAHILPKIFLKICNIEILIYSFQSIGSIPIFIRYSFAFEK